MPIVDEKHTPQHQVLINQSILKSLKTDMEVIKRDINEIKQIILFINEYTKKKKDKEDNKWF